MHLIGQWPPCWDIELCEIFINFDVFLTFRSDLELHLKDTRKKNKTKPNKSSEIFITLERIFFFVLIKQIISTDNTFYVIIFQKLYLIFFEILMVNQQDKIK